MRVHLISHTPLDAPGGVPRFNRYLKRVLEEAGHEVRHWSWWDVPEDLRRLAQGISEDARADSLSRFLIRNGVVDRDDAIIGDGFWCGDFARMGYRRVVSVAHGIWGHVTKDDVDAGVQPENWQLHEAQIRHRLDHRRRGLPIVAVSMFIAEQMRLQWDLDSLVINNAVDPDETDGVLRGLSDWTDDVIVVHGINDRGNANKGWEHIQSCIDAVRDRNYPVRVDFMSLDELHDFVEAEKFEMDKMWSLQHADVALIPSGFEGNSYFALECLNMGVPCVAYDVGLFTQLAVADPEWNHPVILNPRMTVRDIGIVMPRRERCPARTARGMTDFMETGRIFVPQRTRSKVRQHASFDRFRDGWLGVIEDVCRSSSV